MNDGLIYQCGFGNHCSSEALPGALPQGQNSPQKVAYGLYAEQLSGSAFTAPRHENQRSWLYRIRPSVPQGTFTRREQGHWRGATFDETPLSPEQLRWDPFPLPSKPTDFLAGCATLLGNGKPAERRGSAVHLYGLNAPMTDTFFYNADGELLFIPQEGALELRTEFGYLQVAPGEIACLPRGVKFQVLPLGTTAKGYVGENFGLPFRLPALGPIGANGLANSRDFKTPVARYEEKVGPFRLVTKFLGVLWEAPVAASPLDVVAWHGNYAPYKYDLADFQTINTVSFDHPDPSIFTVLTSPSEIPGTANVDFVIFPPRWMVAEHSFRPPYFHRNCMNEYMGLIRGIYDAKATGFLPGGGSLHNMMSAHGPDAETFEKASKAELKPHHIEGTLAFMFESAVPYHPTAFALGAKELQKDYLKCWQGLRADFSSTNP